MTTETPKTPYRPRWALHAVLLTGIAALLVANTVLLHRHRRAEQIHVFGMVPDFSLTERNGSPLGLADLRGKVWIADFIFTHCAGPCPLMSAQMARLQQSLHDQPDLRLVSFSVDPERDTPTVLTEYARSFGAETGRWFFLTGSKAAMYDLANKGFRIGATENKGPDRQPDEGEILHSTSFVLVDRQARIRGYYDTAETNSVRQLLADAKVLLKEK